jgi:hypothetical protein
MRRRCSQGASRAGELLIVRARLTKSGLLDRWRTPTFHCSGIARALRPRTAHSLSSTAGFGCGHDDNGGSEADQRGVGAECADDTDCPTQGASCLLQFKGGYCGFSDCTGNADCPEGSACVVHEDGTNYCFLLCKEKVDCNTWREADSESNCVANVTFVDKAKTSKACVPPSGT